MLRQSDRDVSRDTPQEANLIFAAEGTLAKGAVGPIPTAPEPDPTGRQGRSRSHRARAGKSRGTGAATFWKMWSTYKDVAHLVTAAALVFAHARNMAGSQPFGPFGLSSDQFGQFMMTMLMPDLIIAVALSFERLGLSFVPHGHEEPTLDPERLWRIPPDINVVPIPPPVRKIRPEDLVVLDERRAGNRGKVKGRLAQPEPTNGQERQLRPRRAGPNSSRA
jgi:hypothetical protein